MLVIKPFVLDSDNKCTVHDSYKKKKSPNLKKKKKLCKNSR